jgi:hypothetical protein
MKGVKQNMGLIQKGVWTPVLKSISQNSKGALTMNVETTSAITGQLPNSSVSP